MDWLCSYEGRSLIRSLFDINTYERKNFGFLEKPDISFDVEEVTFKIFCQGKAGVGKTEAITLLTGVDTATTCTETEGISVTVTYWPIKLPTSQIILMRLEFWDAGDTSIKKYGYILPSCMEDVDAVLNTFSFDDRKCFDEVSQLISKISTSSSTLPFHIVIGTRFDNHLTTEITLKEIQDFDNKYKIPLIKVRNTSKALYSTKQIQKFKFREAAQALNSLCQYLWSCRMSKGNDLPNTCVE